MQGYRKIRGGVPDLSLKLEVCCKLLGAMTNNELADKVLSRGRDQLLAGKVADSFRKWAKHSPTKANGPKQFWDALAGELDCEDTVSGVMLIDATIERFIRYLPSNRQEWAREIVSDIRLRDGESSSLPESNATLKTIQAPGRLDDSNTIWLQHTGPVETISTGLRAGKIDQRHFYLDPDSASGWSRLVRADAYPTYDHCKTGLQALVESEPWNASLGSSRPVTAVMLAGGGAPTKDLLFLRSLLAQPYATGLVGYYLVDISLYMLRDSALWIREHSRTIEGYEKIDLKLIHHDVLAMTWRHREQFHQQGKVIFGITGGTIGNFSEETFFRSLDRAADDGDLLIVSADTIDGLPADAVEKTLTRKYDHPDLRRFIRPVVSAVLSESNTQESVSSALARIRVKLSPGGDVYPSNVPGGWSVIVTLDIDGREVILVTSTRYQSTELINYAVRFGWHAVCQIPSPLNPHYKQFLFKRNKAEASGILSTP
jgi:hypothetical protein